MILSPATEAAKIADWFAHCSVNPYKCSETVSPVWNLPLRVWLTVRFGFLLLLLATIILGRHNVYYRGPSGNCLYFNGFREQNVLRCTVCPVLAARQQRENAENL